MKSIALNKPKEVEPYVEYSLLSNVCNPVKIKDLIDNFKSLLKSYIL